ncbi:MAG TPA: DNA polymerase I, partial [Caulobacteraceae bacterium]|nr:DNA polymerase I [Caulobacteraceae bacterium]
MTETLDAAAETLGQIPREPTQDGPPVRLYIVDGSGFIFRAFHALPPLTRKSDGLPVGAVAGFCNMLWKLMVDMKAAPDAPTHLAVVFDKSEVTFRNQLYADYKAHRPPPPEDLVPQFPLMREATRAFGVPCLELGGYEADDIIAAYACKVRDGGGEVVIVSSDKDLMQLVGDRVTMLDTMKNVRIGLPEVFDKFGVTPDKVVDVQALCGDSVDNVPGAPGIGVKTASALINEYGDLETLLARAGEIKQDKRRQTLIDFADQIRLSRQLVQLDCDTPLPSPIDDLAVEEPDAEVLGEFLERMEFRTLARRVVEARNGGAPAPAPKRPEAEAPKPIDTALYACVRDLAALDGWIAKARAAGIVAFDAETDGSSSASSDLVGVSLAVAPGEACYIPLAHSAAEGLALETAADLEQAPMAAALERLKALLEDPGVLKVGHNAKYDMAVFSRLGVEVAPVEDTMLISYTLEGGAHSHGMDELAQLWLSHEPISLKSVTGTGKAQKRFRHVDLASATCYAAEDADITIRLHRLLRPRLAREGLLTVYETLERPLPKVLAQMELAGIKIDPSQLHRLSNDFSQRMADYEVEATRLVGRPFNLGSPKQIGDVLFGEMGLPGGKKTATGVWSTDASVLDQLAAEGHPLPRLLLDWRQLSKLKGTYTDALASAVSPRTGRIHTSYALASTTTGRLSSNDPNLQNIPVRTEEGRKIRRAFVAEKGHKLLSVDYSQIELRLAAHIAEVAALKEAFRKGEDIHAMTASQVFGVPVAGMDPMVRRKAKAINFGIIYGISAFGLGQQLGIPQAEAKAYIEAYFAKYPGIRDYMERAKDEARKKGYVTTLFGRRCHVPGIADKNPARRSFMERAAINAPLQGTAADIIKRAMIRMPAALAHAKLKARMLLQVHDELLFEV